jgi:hypothetical protein
MLKTYAASTLLRLAREYKSLAAVRQSFLPPSAFAGFRLHQLHAQNRAKMAVATKKILPRNDSACGQMALLTEPEKSTPRQSIDDDKPLRLD